VRTDKEFKNFVLIIISFAIALLILAIVIVLINSCGLPEDITVTETIIPVKVYLDKHPHESGGFLKILGKTKNLTFAYPLKYDLKYIKVVELLNKHLGEKIIFTYETTSFPRIGKSTNDPWSVLKEIKYLEEIRE